MVPRVDIGGFEVDLSDPTIQAYVGGAFAAVLGGIGLLAGQQQQQQDGASGWKASGPLRGFGSPAGPSVTDAVGVFGATGKTGSRIVSDLLTRGKDVVGFCRDVKKAEEQFKNITTLASGSLVLRQADVTKFETLLEAPEKLLDGVSQLVVSLGPIYGKQEDGTFGPVDGMTPEAVDYQGVANIVKTAQRAMVPKTEVEYKDIYNFGWNQVKGAEEWTNFDDTIMGGTSKSELKPAGGMIKWEGELVTDGGGFCGMRTKEFENQTVSLSDFDGIRLRVRGDGNRYKFTVSLRDGRRYQHPFQTQKGIIQDVELKFENFVALSTQNANNADYSCEPLSQADRSDVAFLNIVLSKFEFNGYPNPAGVPEKFSLLLEKIEGFSNPKPQIVLVTSAACERNARITSQEERNADIPIVQLNPNGILNWKYKGEFAVRNSGFSYTVVRPCGLTTINETEKYELELRQGDIISGAISRSEVASLVTTSLFQPGASGKTFEARRSEAKDGKGKDGVAPAVISRQILTLVPDSERFTRGLPVLPPALDPPAAELSEEEKEKVLNDPRVRAKREAEPGEQQVVGRDDTSKGKNLVSAPSIVVYRNGQPVEENKANSAPSFVVYRNGQLVA